MTARSTKSELARSLKIHRSQLDGFLSRPGAPSPDAGKRYDSKAVASFIAAQREPGALDSLRAARLREIQLRCQRLEMEIARDAKETVKRSAVDELHSRMAQRLKSLLYSKLENELPPKMAGCDALALRAYGRNLADEIVGRLRRDVDEWES